jgi:hypothetical protein
LRKGLLIAGREPTSLFEQIEGAFDVRAGLVQLLVVRQLPCAATVRWDDGLASPPVQLAPEKVRVIGLVREQTLRRRPSDESRGWLAVVALALGNLERQRKSEGIDDQMDFR